MNGKIDFYEWGAKIKDANLHLTEKEATEQWRGVEIEDLRNTRSVSCI
jgi:hypothetical protein